VALLCSLLPNDSSETYYKFKFLQALLSILSCASSWNCFAQFFRILVRVIVQGILVFLFLLSRLVVCVCLGCWSGSRVLWLRQTFWYFIMGE